MRNRTTGGGVIFELLAITTVFVHVGFIAFIILGGLALARHQWLIWLHAPTIIYSVVIQIIGFPCILTVLEQYFLRLAGETPYVGEFLPHYFWNHIGLTGSEPIVVAIFITFILAMNAPHYIGWARS